ncbi:MAG: hypothetical protein DRP74_02675 [Candidatus Omnitrophota bacterium]|nr:MAG: hypothetical protein DRP74_02675 [Candidatus Omnitrophota bacterium]
MVKKLLILAIVLLLFTYGYCGDISKSHTYINGEVLTAALLNTSFDEIINEVNDLDTDNLASNIAITTSGNSTFSGTLTASGGFTSSGNTTLGDGSSELLTINCANGITFTPAVTWTFTADQTVSGTWADLGTVTTVDINGGTIDGVTIGASSAPTVTNLGTVTTCDINGGSIDGVTIGATSAPTVTNLGNVATTGTVTLGGKLTGGANEIEGSNFDIDGGSIDGVTIGGSSAGAITCTTLNTGGKLTAGANEIEGSNFDIDGGSIDGVTIGAASAPTVTDIDINGGTMDGVQIGGTTATGELIVNNASDDADGLGSQGTAGQFLQSQGAGVNPIWAYAFKEDGSTVLSETEFPLSWYDLDISAYVGSNAVLCLFKITAQDTPPEGTTDKGSIRTNGSTDAPLEQYFHEGDYNFVWAYTDANGIVEYGGAYSNNRVRAVVELVGYFP